MLQKRSMQTGCGSYGKLKRKIALKIRFTVRVGKPNIHENDQFSEEAAVLAKPANDVNTQPHKTITAKSDSSMTFLNLTNGSSLTISSCYYS